MNIFDSTGLIKNNTGGLANYDVIVLRDEKAQNTSDSNIIQVQQRRGLILMGQEQ